MITSHRDLEIIHEFLKVFITDKIKVKSIIDNNNLFDLSVNETYYALRNLRIEIEEILQEQEL